MPVLSTQAPAKVPDHSEAHCLLCWTPRPQRFTQEILLLMLTVEDHHGMFPHDVPAGELRSVACLEYAAPVRGRARAAVRQWFALSNLWVGWGGMLGRFGGSGQYSLRFAASSDSTSSRKSHRSQSGQLCSTLDPQSPTICPVDTVACASRNTLPLNVCLEICVPRKTTFGSCMECAAPGRGSVVLAFPQQACCIQFVGWVGLVDHSSQCSFRIGHARGGFTTGTVGPICRLPPRRA